VSTFIAGHLWRVTRVATGVGGAPYYITGYFDASAGTAQQAADAWANLLGTTSTIYRNGLVYAPISSVQEIDAPTGNLVGLAPVTVAGVTFAGGTDPLPPSAQLLLQWHTGQYSGGHEYRGRTNIPGLMASGMVAGAPSSTIVSSFQTRVTAMLALSSAKHCVYSRKNGDAAITTTGTVWNQYAVLRSRRD
jgi:hypothetical protein